MKYSIEDLSTEVSNEIIVTKNKHVGGKTKVMIHMRSQRLDITGELIWNKNSSRIVIEEQLSLQEIYDQTLENFGMCTIDNKWFCPIIDVIVEDYREGYIYQCNNYEEGSWYLYGILGGIA